MHNELPFQVAFVLLSVGLIALRLYFHIRARVWTSGVSNPSEGRGVWLARIVLLPAWLGIMALWLIAPQSAPWLQFPLPARLRWAGVPVTMIGLALLFWVHRTLDTNFSPFLRIRADHHLITHGPYKRVRHPMYSAFLVIVGGLSLVSATWLLAVTGFLMLGIVIGERTPREERMLVDRFGDEYRAYIARTGRLLPRFRRRR